MSPTNNAPSGGTKRNALVIGSNGAIGRALVDQLSTDYRVSVLSRRKTDYSESSLQRFFKELSTLGEFDRIICCVGVLQDANVSPEKNLKQVNQQGLQHYFHVNTILPMLCLKFFHPLLTRQRPSVFACLSAMVGSIEDNQLGGWYGYRSSKAALNMLVKTTAIEVARVNKQARIIAIHPGTTISDLSKPFASKVTKDKYYTPEQSAARIIQVMDAAGEEDTGLFFNWSGENLPW